MGISEKYLNLDDHYARVSQKIIINDINFFKAEDTAKINAELMTIYNSVTISITPQCNCGNLKGAYVENKLCHSCGSLVKDPTASTEPLLWFKILDGQQKFINPLFWMMLRTILHKKIDCLRWLSDTSYNPPVELPVYLHQLKDIIGGERTYNNLVNNMDKLITAIQHIPHFKKAEKVDLIKELYNMYFNIDNKYYVNKLDLVSTYIPVVNKKLFVMENTSKGKFTNLVVSDVINPVMSWMHINSVGYTDRKASNAMGSLMSAMANMYTNYFTNYIITKTGIFRKHLYGARSHFTFRSVISSLEGPHEYDEIHVPWVIGVTVFRPHIINKLYKRGYTHKQSNAILYRAVNAYIPVIDEILQELITESNGGIKVIGQRNPSLKPGSAQMLRITRFKNNILDKAIDISQLIITSPNADLMFNDIVIQGPSYSDVCRRTLLITGTLKA